MKIAVITDSSAVLSETIISDKKNLIKDAEGMVKKYK